jgi:hypothetical protein
LHPVRTQDLCFIGGPYLKSDIYGGNATGDFSISLVKSTPTFTAASRVLGINTARLLAAFHDLRGFLTGNLDGDFTLAGAIEHTPPVHSRECEEPGT